MNPAEALSKAGAKSQSYGDRIDTDFLDGLSWQDIIGLTQGLSELHFSLMLAKYGMDGQSIFTVKAEMMVLFCNDFARLKVKNGTRKDLFSGLVLAAMEDVIPPHICRDCSNGYIIPINEKGVAVALPYECKTCGGTGKYNLTPPQLAGIAGLSEVEFKKYKPLHDRMIMKLQEVEAESISHMRERYEKDA